MEQKFLTLDEVAQYLNVDYQFVYKLVRSGDLPSLRLGRIYRVDIDHLKAYIDRNTTGDAVETVKSAGTCAACGKSYDSAQSLRHTCQADDCTESICFDCWERADVHYCTNHEHDS